MSQFRSSPVRAAVLLCFSVLLPVGAMAQSQAPAAQSVTRDYRIGAGPLGLALSQFATQANVRLSFPGTLVQGMQSSGLNGNYSVAEGFAALLSGSGLRAVPAGANEYTLSAVPANAVT